MKYKAIISDVDGTLIQQARTGFMNGLPSESVTKAIAKIKDTIHFGIATSRPLSAVEYIFDHLSLTGPCIINGGSIIVDPVSKKILWEKYIENDAVAAILQIAREKHIRFEIHDKKLGKIESLQNGHTFSTVYSIFLSELTNEEVDELHNTLMDIPTIALHKVASYSPELMAFDITHAEATKQHGILQVAKILNLYPEEIIGIGDGYNDFPLLMACGLKVAMGNAVEDLKAIADYVAPTVDDDGLADVIEKFIV